MKFYVGGKLEYSTHNHTKSFRQLKNLMKKYKKGEITKEEFRNKCKNNYAARKLNLHERI